MARVPEIWSQSHRATEQSCFRWLVFQRIERQAAKPPSRDLLVARVPEIGSQSHRAELFRWLVFRACSRDQVAKRQKPQSRVLAVFVFHRAGHRAIEQRSRWWFVFQKIGPSTSPLVAGKTERVSWAKPKRNSSSSGSDLCGFAALRPILLVRGRGAKPQKTFWFWASDSGLGGLAVWRSTTPAHERRAKPERLWALWLCGSVTNLSGTLTKRLVAGESAAAVLALLL